MTRPAALVAVVATAWLLSATGSPMRGAAIGLPTPIPHPSQTPPPDVAAPSPTPLPPSFNGQLIDVERGYVVFSTGDALRLAPDAVIVDAATKAAPAYALRPGLYAVAVLDPATALVTELRLARKPLPGGTPAPQIPRQYVAALSSPQPNPDLVPRASVYETKLSQAVLVDITVQVPPNTPYTDDVYLATDTSGWNAQAIKMQRIDGLHFHIQASLKGGTEFHYLFTRGSWKTVERDRAGLERKARDLFVLGGEAQVIAATVYRWADLP